MSGILFFGTPGMDLSTAVLYRIADKPQHGMGPVVEGGDIVECNALGSK